MKQQNYSIFDEIIQQFHTPFQATNDNEARRNVRLAAQDPSSTLSKSPQDYSLYLVGVFNTDTGLHEPLTQPLLLDRVTALCPPPTLIQG